eukprot:15466560-Alexandrium_andersonii.AAC.2
MKCSEFELPSRIAVEALIGSASPDVSNYRMCNAPPGHGLARAEASDLAHSHQHHDPGVGGAAGEPAAAGRLRHVVQQVRHARRRRRLPDLIRLRSQEAHARPQQGLHMAK